MTRASNHPPGCGACKEGMQQPIPFSMAFQPIVDVREERVFAYEALVRGVHGESAYSVLSQLTPETRYAFDQSCRVKALTLASELGLVATGAKLSINFMPGAVYSPAACIQLTLNTAHVLNFPLDRLIFEVTEAEEVKDRKHLVGIAREYRRHGFHVALDDYGAGYSGLNLLADLSPEEVKLDMDLIRDLQRRPVARAIVRSTAELCATLGLAVVAEGVETLEEYEAVLDCGIHLMQGYLLAKPGFEMLPEVTMPGRSFTPDAGKASDPPQTPVMPVAETLVQIESAV